MDFGIAVIILSVILVGGAAFAFRQYLRHLRRD